MWVGQKPNKVSFFEDKDCMCLRTSLLLPITERNTKQSHGM